MITKTRLHSIMLLTWFGFFISTLLCLPLHGWVSVQNFGAETIALIAVFIGVKLFGEDSK